MEMQVRKSSGVQHIATQRPHTEHAARRPSRPNTRSKTTAGRLPSRPHTVATTRTWYYGKPPPKEAHASVIDWNKAKLIKAPILARRTKSSQSLHVENVENTEVSVLQPYPMNYNAFLVQSLTRDLDRLYATPDNIIITRTKRQNSMSDEELEDSTYWKMT